MTSRRVQKDSMSIGTKHLCVSSFDVQYDGDCFSYRISHLTLSNCFDETCYHYAECKLIEMQLASKPEVPQNVVLQGRDTQESTRKAVLVHYNSMWSYTAFGEKNLASFCKHFPKAKGNYRGCDIHGCRECVVRWIQLLACT